MTYRMMTGGALVSFVVIAGLIYSRSNAPHPGATAPQSSAPGEIAALRAELNELKRNSAASLLLARAANERAAMSGAVAKPENAPAAAPSAAASAEPTDEERAAAERRAELELAQSLDRKFAAEPVDRQWAGQAAEEAKRALVSQIDSDSSVRGVECRSTWCRIETFHASLDAFKGFTKESLLGRQRQLWNGAISSTVREDSDSGVTAVTFISREGHPMPLPDGVEPTAMTARVSR